MSRRGIVLRQDHKHVQRQRPLNGIRTDDREVLLEVRRAEGLVEDRVFGLSETLVLNRFVVVQLQRQVELAAQVVPCRSIDSRFDIMVVAAVVAALWSC